MKTHQIKVDPEQLDIAVGKGASKGWKLINTKTVEGGQLLLTFAKEDVPSPVTTNIETVEKKKSGLLRSLFGWCAFSVLVCIGFAVAIPLFWSMFIGDDPATTSDLEQEMKSGGLNVSNVVLRGDTLTVSVPISELEPPPNYSLASYRTSYAYEIAQIIAREYKRGVVKQPPKTIVISFSIHGGSSRWQFSYESALAYSDGRISRGEFISSIDID